MKWFNKLAGIWVQLLMVGRPAEKEKWDELASSMEMEERNKTPMADILAPEPVKEWREMSSEDWDRRCKAIAEQQRATAEVERRRAAKAAKAEANRQAAFHRCYNNNGRYIVEPAGAWEGEDEDGDYVLSDLAGSFVVAIYFCPFCGEELSKI